MYTKVLGYPSRIADPARDFKARTARYVIARSRVSLINGVDGYECRY